ncbi:MFS transporter [Arsenicicoccus piscis]|uniref:MFS transporter n=1 Tax=Arsenicicoccus piscis TaxID=673954 RepID=UPI001F4CDE36|nr:MFS transporter [Arsenicicoccus piscis]MCH8627975.1 MFS transporter [Arsenicicoccus piscis]
MSEPAITSLRAIAVPAYGPTLLSGIGTGAMAPAIPLFARELGASVGTAGLITALFGLGVLAADLPAGELAARIGERLALLYATAFGGAVTLVAAHTRSLAVLAIAVFAYGLCGAVFGLARMAYLTEAAPAHLRARAMSTLGGTMRVGRFLGPFLAAAIVTQRGVAGAFELSAAMDLLAFAVVWRLPDLPGERRAPVSEATVLAVLRRSRRVLATLGVGALLVAAARALRDVVLPLWGDHLGLSPATTALVFGIAGGAEMLLFYPAGMVMDRFGRAFTAVPAMLGLGLGFLLLPLATNLGSFTAAAVFIGVANGIGAGILMTLGADSAPPDQRSRFLGAWRLVADVGSAGGPALLSAATVVVSLGAAISGAGVLALLGAGWLGYWIPRSGPARDDDGQGMAG